MNAEATTTVGITKGIKVKLSKNLLNLNSDLTNTLDMHSPIATDNAVETVACHIVNQSAFRTDTEVKACSKEKTESDGQYFPNWVEEENQVKS